MEQRLTKNGAKINKGWSKGGQRMDQRWSIDGAQVDTEWSKDRQRMEQLIK